ncbi:MAG: hypothetical protein KatS3mg123_2799 [Burkholderiales bacterium]|nr:MAG: hypothetical protein KatS3mg123_2799 [Burkholderiales bacterium]
MHAAHRRLRERVRHHRRGGPGTGSERGLRLGGERPAPAGPERHRRDPGVARSEPGHAGDPDDQLLFHRERHRGAAHRRHRLHHQAVQQRRLPVLGGTGPGRAAHAQRERDAQAQLEARLLEPPHHRGKRGHLAGAGHDPAGGRLRRQRADRGRERHGQGAGGPGDPLREPPRRRSFRAHQLRRDSRRSPGVRAVRPRQGGLHRGGGGSRRADPGGERRNPVPGRNLGTGAQPAGEAPAGVAGAAGAAAGVEAHLRHRRPLPRREQPGSQAGHGARPVSRRPVLPAQRDHHPRASPAGAGPGRGNPSPALHRGAQPAAG